MNNIELTALEKQKTKVFMQTLDLYKKANCGHVGSSLSCLDLMVYLFFYRMSEEDKFVLSKGHAAAVYYVILAQKGLIDAELLNTFYTDGTFLAAHPPCSGKLPAITFGTGSLGHGLSLAVGVALACKIKNTKSNVYCLVSDGDCNEGSLWEAAMFACHHKLDNLYVILDKNDLQGFGTTDSIINMGDIVSKWESFGFETFYAPDGHDFKEIDDAFSRFDHEEKPKCLIAKTIKGKGILTMENKLESHYLPMKDAEYITALKHLIERLYA